MATKAKKGATKVAAGLVAAGVVAAAAGYYFYGSTKAKEHRKIASKWATSMKNEVVRESKRLKEINAKDFGKIVDTVARTYDGVRSIKAADLKRAANELKRNWKTVQAEVGNTNRKNVNAVKKVVRKVTKHS